ncbi:bifunctional oligoribonuclease/PAP phosphatase NrnA [Finegoldia magna]|uniref:Bifunctional oligoribonuclease/PAP phosphatase NrnA n=1 Tax=Finegoldia magna TaxID=1260 RepID=A0A233VIU0_FINMA|nr:bifunctional oligoribonuclease/PAP phosphatase NrnA [Finegoldia magna]MBS5965070.1 bifunctional oligoribonuclease/PAP phosphatase NrnA [Finegoldia magna]MDU2897455.1 bifunctional oligoribonuclease/PAP phosphatase NrnA [Finegoldia magna]MDU5368398.1 bifunctional oligoribonuclease/PAP phosphatase NrnA [Finegoldia magna]MDU5444568.1 bifunctional oligoribonuclease/PAP phosphatase NrnA [Finegoldia magna]MDU5507761.1 bifunctional oligoribonuclease/PAP phosphatase NrnA [Finegoldia magna]
MKINDEILKFKEQLKDANSIALISHLDPDGDNLGSLTALSKSLLNLGKKVYPIEFDKIPENLKFLPNLDLLSDNTDININMIICLDCANYERLGKVDELFNKAKYRINIDHHQSNEFYGDVNIVKKGYSSTCELVFDLINEINLPIDKEISMSLLTGISTDTGRFLYSATTADTLAKASRLVENGADMMKINELIYQSKKFEAQLLENEILSKTEIYNDYVAFSFVMTDQLNKYNVEISDIDSVINTFRDTDKIKISVLIKQQTENEYKVSFRSKGNIDVGLIAKNLGGGGHKNAAATRITGDFETVSNKIKEEIDRYGLCN